MTSEQNTEFMDLNDDCISAIIYCLDSRSRKIMRSLNNRLHHIVFAVVEHIRRFQVQSVILKTSISLEDMGIRRDPTTYIRMDHVRRDAWVAHYLNNRGHSEHEENSAFKKMRSLFPRNFFLQPNRQYSLEQRIYMDVFHKACQVFRTNDDIYGAELHLHYKKRFDTFVIMHPKSLDFVKDWLEVEEWKSNEQYNGMLKELREVDQHLALFPEEKILIQYKDKLRRTVLVFTPEPYKSMFIRLKKTVVQDCLNQFTIEKMCLSNCLMDWLLRVDCTATNLTITNCMYTAESSLLANLLDILQPRGIELQHFGFLMAENPLKQSFWKCEALCSAASISIIAYADPRPCYNYGIQNYTFSDVYVHNFGHMAVDLNKMQFHTLQVDVDELAVAKANQLLKVWQNSSRVIEYILLRGITRLDDVLLGIRKKEDKLRYELTYLILRNRSDVLSIGPSRNDRSAIEIKCKKI